MSDKTPSSPEELIEEYIRETYSGTVLDGSGAWQVAAKRVIARLQERVRELEQENLIYSFERTNMVAREHYTRRLDAMVRGILAARILRGDKEAQIVDMISGASQVLAAIDAHVAEKFKEGK